MITSYEVGAIFRIQDDATAALKRIATEAQTAAGALDAVKASLTSINRTKFTRLMGRLAALTDQVDRMKATFGTALTTVDAGIAGTTGAVATLAGEWAAVATQAKIAAQQMRSANLIGNPRSRVLGPHSGGVGGGGNGVHISSFGVPVPGGHARFRVGGNAAMAGLGALAYGVYEEAEVEEIAAKALMTGQIRVDAGMTNMEAFKKLRDVIQKNASLGGFDVKQVGEAMLGSERQFAGLPFDKRMEVLDVMLPAAMQEARFKETNLKEAAEALVGVSHMTGVYDPAKLPELYRKFNFASMITPASLPAFQNALSYSMPSLVAGMGMDPDAIMFLTAMNQAAGIRSTKAGTWVQAFFGKLMPDVGMNLTHNQQKHNDSLKELGLLDESGQPSWMIKGANGKTDWLGSLLKLSPILGQHLQALPETQRLQMLDQVFGKQGGREAGLTNLPEFIAQFPRLAEMMKTAPNGDDFLKQLHDASPVQQARQAWSDLKNVLMDIGAVVLPPLIGALQGLDAVFKALKDHMPSPGSFGGAPTKGSLGDALGKGMLTGGLVGAGVGFLAAGPAGVLPGAAYGAFMGGSATGGAHILGIGVKPQGEGAANVSPPPNVPLLPDGISPMTPIPQKFNGDRPPVQLLNWQPPQRAPQPVVFSLKIDMDGRTLAEVLSTKIAEMLEHPTSAPYWNGNSRYEAPDSQAVAI